MTSSCSSMPRWRASPISFSLMLRDEAPSCAEPSSRPTNAVPEPRASHLTSTSGWRALNAAAKSWPSLPPMVSEPLTWRVTAAAVAAGGAQSQVATMVAATAKVAATARAALPGAKPLRAISMERSLPRKWQASGWRRQLRPGRRSGSTERDGPVDPDRDRVPGLAARDEAVLPHGVERGILERGEIQPGAIDLGVRHAAVGA